MEESKVKKAIEELLLIGNQQLTLANGQTDATKAKAHLEVAISCFSSAINLESGKIQLEINKLSLITAQSAHKK